MYIDDEDNKPIKGEIKATGYISSVPEAEVRATKVDIKILFIPASSVEIMSAKKVDIKNLIAVSKFLGL